MAYELTYKFINPKGKDYTKLEEIFHEAFCKHDRPISLDNITKICVPGKGSFALGAYKDNQPVGLATYQRYDDFIFVYYIAVDDNLRQKGYGSSIVRDLLAMNKNRDVLVAAETENKNEENSSYQARGREFLESNNFTYSKYEYWDAGVKYNIATTGDTSKIPGCIALIVKSLESIMTDEELKNLRKIADQK